MSWDEICKVLCDGVKFCQSARVIQPAPARAHLLALSHDGRTRVTPCRPHLTHVLVRVQLGLGSGDRQGNLEKV
jgi:hypothetical protein